MPLLKQNEQNLWFRKLNISQVVILVSHNLNLAKKLARLKEIYKTIFKNVAKTLFLYILST